MGAQSDARKSGALTGGLTGAGTGAAVGSAFGPIGSAAGALLGGVTGAIAGSKQADAQYEQRKEEVNRVEEREDTAIRRATQDSLIAGVDPRGSETPPAAGSASVAPIDLERPSDNLAKVGSTLQSALSSRIDLEAKTAETLHQSWRSYVDSGYNALAEDNKEYDSLLAQEREQLQISEAEQSAIENDYQYNYSEALDKLKGCTVTEGASAILDRLVNELHSTSAEERENAVREFEHLFGLKGSAGLEFKKSFVPSLTLDGSVIRENKQKAHDEKGKTRGQKDEYGNSSKESNTVQNTRSVNSSTSRKIASGYSDAIRDRSLSAKSKVYSGLTDESKANYRLHHSRIQNKKRMDYERANTGFSDYVNKTSKYSRKFFRFLRDPFGDGMGTGDYWSREEDIESGNY